MKIIRKVRYAHPQMTDDGAITREGPDADTGPIRLAGDEGAMTMKFNGGRVVARDPARK